MRKLLKIVTIIIAILLLTVAIAVGVVMTIINPNDFKTTIQKQVQRITGRELLIQGDIHWSFFPWLALQVRDAQLSNPPGFNDSPFAKLAEADIQVKLLPLFHQTIEMGKVNLKGLQIALIKKANGDNNWQNLMQKHSIKSVNTANEVQVLHADESSSTSSELTPANVAVAPLALTISNVQITDAKISFDDQQQQQHYNVDNLQLLSNKLSLDKRFPLQLSFDFNSSQPQRSGKFKLNSDVTVNRLQQEYSLTNFNVELHVNDKKLPQPVNLTMVANIHAKKDLLNIDDLKIQLDNSTITGKLALSDVAKQASTFTLAINRLDLDRYIPTKSASAPITPTPVVPTVKVETAPAASPAVVAAAASKEFPTDTLRKLNLNGSLTIEDLKVAKLQANGVKLNLKADQGLITVAPIKAKLYEGNYTGQLIIDARNAVPHYSFNENLAGVQLGPMLQQLDGQKRFEMTGALNLNAVLTARGVDSDKLLKTLTGPVSIQVLNGSLKGIDASYQVRRAQAFLKKQPEPTQTGANQTDFGSLTATFAIKQGNASNHDLLLQSAVVKMTGEGNIDLAKQHFDYQLTATVLGSGLDQQTKEAQEFIGGGVPLQVTGDFSHVKVTPDWDALGRAVVKSAIKQHAEKLKIKVGEKLEKALGSETGKKLKEQLEGLFR
ncbi:AsmA family protein [soil metagenome]